MMLMELLSGEGVMGVARLAIVPSFDPAEVYTLVYTETAVTVSAEQSAFVGSATRELRELRRMRLLANWQTIRSAALGAPSCSSMSVDGTTYRHSICDHSTVLDVEWSNPDPKTHRAQCALIAAYRKLIDLAGVRLEVGRGVIVRTGMFAGLEGKITWINERCDRVRVKVTMLGKGAEVELPCNDVRLPG
jgi:transcription antitermination factor NusG